MFELATERIIHVLHFSVFFQFSQSCAEGQYVWPSRKQLHQVGCFGVGLGPAWIPMTLLIKNYREINTCIICVSNQTETTKTNMHV